MSNNSKNRWEGFKVVVEDRWSLNSSGRYHDFDCIPIETEKLSIFTFPIISLWKIQVAIATRVLIRPE